MNTSLYNRTIHLLREAKATYKSLALMWAGGKDSTLMLYLTRQAYYNQLPPVVFLDTTFAFRETKEFIRTVSKLWNLDLIYAQNRQALSEGCNPWTLSHMECCTKLKTDALHACIEKHGFDALLFGIRHDEHAIRGKEKVFSPRDVPEHMRVHPLLDWMEQDVWQFTKKHGLPINPLYNRRVEDKRYYSLGCYPCTKPMSPIDYRALGERGGRSQDKEQIMERLRALGYM